MVDARADQQDAQARGIGREAARLSGVFAELTEALKAAVDTVTGASVSTPNVLSSMSVLQAVLADVPAMQKDVADTLHKAQQTMTDSAERARQGHAARSTEVADDAQATPSTGADSTST